MKTYIWRYQSWRGLETEGPKGKPPYITPPLRGNASVRSSPVGGTVGRSGKTRTEGNGGEGGCRDVSRGGRVAVMEAFDKGRRVEVVVGHPRVGSIVTAFPFG